MSAVSADFRMSLREKVSRLQLLFEHPSSLGLKGGTCMSARGCTTLICDCLSVLPSTFEKLQVAQHKLSAEARITTVLSSEREDADDDDGNSADAWRGRGIYKRCEGLYVKGSHVESKRFARMSCAELLAVLPAGESGAMGLRRRHGSWPIGSPRSRLRPPHAPSSCLQPSNVCMFPGTSGKTRSEFLI